MLVKILDRARYLNLLTIVSSCLSTKSTQKKSRIKQEYTEKQKGNIYIKSTNRNIFCTLMDVEDKKVKTSCSLRVPDYENEFNERENLFKRGMLLGELFGDKMVALGYSEVAIYLDCGINKGRKGFVRGLGKKKIKISFIELLKGYSHNGCRPAKVRRKKVRTKPKN